MALRFAVLLGDKRASIGINHLPNRGGDEQQIVLFPCPSYRVRHGPVVGKCRPWPQHAAFPLGGMGSVVRDVKDRWLEWHRSSEVK